MLLSSKPDGGELYLISPEAHGLQVINTRHPTKSEDYMDPRFRTPHRAILSADASVMYVSDATANRIIPVDIVNRRRLDRDPGMGFTSPPDRIHLRALRFDPQENLFVGGQPEFQPLSP